ncbi:putative glutathione transferase omega-1 protein [Erysiphe necator]|uniref:Putative glutathione transferase omega-1 protein n=1 Tax=Uncinula necator TaxID=52586 RepID=A0A0B1NYX4_UNCNE|nr:putative glutathione transferase omega-1 protein [Erysiphe necator]
MDNYAPAFVAHNIPLILVSGLNSDFKESSIQQTDTHELNVGPEEAATLSRLLQDVDASNLAWNSQAFSANKRFRVKMVGREYTLPPRTANPFPAQALGTITKSILHSTLSPLSQESSLFPDGLIDSKWIDKHQEFVPCALVSFYKFSSDPKLYQHHDELLKIAIRRERNLLNLSGYKSYLVVALISDNATVISPEIEERLSRIRKETGLDTKTSLLFLSSQKSNAELKGSVKNLINKIYPPCMEYYRDLSKHCRRKKNKGSFSRPTQYSSSAASQTLSNNGWIFRYDFKLGVFAEFRQEMDSALRSYEAAYETLLGTDIFESMTLFSSRWVEARNLADIIALRIVRCLLWNQNYGAAVRRWTLHKEQIKDLIDRNGEGPAVHDWNSWKARWATIMAETISRVSIPEFSGLAKYVLPEKNFMIRGDVKPWEYLHHPGYWFRIASNYLIASQNRASQITEETSSLLDPSESLCRIENSSILNTNKSFDISKKNPPSSQQSVEYSSLILEFLRRAILEFRQRNQFHIVQELQLLSANELVRKESWDEAFKILSNIWKNMPYRNECWWNIVEEILWALRKAAFYVGDAGSILAVDWELMNKEFTYNPCLPYNLSKSLEGMDLKYRPSIVLHNTELHSFLSVTYIFDSPKIKVGDMCLSQFVVSSNAISSAAPILVSKVEICFEGKIGSIILEHHNSEIMPLGKDGLLSIRRVSLDDPLKTGITNSTVSTSLLFESGSTSVFEFNSYLKEAGEVRAATARFFISLELFDLEYVHKIPRKTTPGLWWGEKSARKRPVHISASSITVLPKPPKLKLQFKIMDHKYCINEKLDLQLVIINDEDNDVFVALDAQFLEDQVPKVLLEIESKLENNSDNIETKSDKLNLKGIYIGKIISGESATVNVVVHPFELTGKFELFLKADYRLANEIETSMLKTASIELQIIVPFEASYDFSPRIHPDPWPSLFSHMEGIDETDSQELIAQGIPQKWCLTTHCTSLLSSDIIIEDISTEINLINGNIKCLTTKWKDFPQSGLNLPPGTLHEAKFDITTQNIDIDDRSTTTIDKSLLVLWRRNKDNSPTIQTKLNIPRLHVSGSEPRVISEVSYDSTNPLIAHFNIMIENPSHHFLSFGLFMESSESFAFSGIKQGILQLLPLSRKRIQFQILPYVRGKWLGPIQCVIRDRYFQKVLRVIPSDGMMIDKEGIMIWIPK